MIREARKFSSHQEADEADRRYYRSLTPEQRLEILLDLIAAQAGHEAPQGLARVCHVTKLRGS